MAEVREMDPIKTGELIRALRMELGMTQQQLAQRLHVGDKGARRRMPRRIPASVSG